MLKHLKISSNVGIVIGSVLILLGVIALSFNYINIKKQNVFTKLSIELYDDIMPEIVDEKEEKEPTKEEIEKNEIQVEEASSNNANANYTYFKGVIEIPKIGLKNGFLDVNSPYNKVDYNVTVISPSDFPDVEKGNLILASHSGSGYIAFFRNLYLLNLNDQVYIYYNGVKYTYSIKNIYTQPKVGALEVKRNKNKKTLTLITCTKNDEKTQTVYIAEIME